MGTKSKHMSLEEREDTEGKVIQTWRQTLSDTPTSQEMPRTASSPKKLGNRCGTDFPSEYPKVKQP